MTVRAIELLSPARDAQCAIAAIDHGADAVYIGAPQFGARAAATNSLEDLARVAEYAHTYDARVYATVNTLLFDHELPEAERLCWQLYHAGIDALIVQDMGITRLHLPPMPLHASTQTDNRTPEKVKFLADAGFRRIVLARELSLNEIRRIHAATDVPLEVFVHGALCVSYSGQCYISQACTGRSANRGECAQLCRLPYTWIDADGKIIARRKHLLSLRDLNQSDRLETLLDAGATSLKIEGRLKELSYVKNVTAYYRQRLDEIFARRPEYARTSAGISTFVFQPTPYKSFARGFTNYFLDGLNATVSNPDTPKSVGEEMGMVKEVKGNCVTIAGVKSFHNGDGICFYDARGELQGSRINRVEANRLYFQEPLAIAPRTVVYRNYDREWEQMLTSPDTAKRRIAVDWQLRTCEFGFVWELSDENGNRYTRAFVADKQLAKTSQADNLHAQLMKLGNTPFTTRSIDVQQMSDYFIPLSQLATWRRQMIEGLLRVRRIRFRRECAVIRPTTHPYPAQKLTYLGNVANAEAAAFYRAHRVEQIDAAFEVQPPATAVPLMFTKYCLRYAMGWCPVHQGKRSPYREPFVLQAPNGQRFRLEFDCKKCEMRVIHSI
ncbi:MAG: U32 family peptidase [Prevotellaceae bacterium]|jgi:putative protease|nr:U32 family peptidase [Prevotellaceae bacterium]